MMNDEGDEMDLNSYFEAGRAAAPPPSDALLARVLADARAQQGAELPHPVRKRAVPSFWAAIGGWPAAAGLVMATLVGVWIGVYQPAGLDLVAGSYLGGGNDSDLVDLMPAFDDFLLEG